MIDSSLSKTREGRLSSCSKKTEGSEYGAAAVLLRFEEDVIANVVRNIRNGGMFVLKATNSYGYWKLQ